MQEMESDVASRAAVADKKHFPLCRTISAINDEDILSIITANAPKQAIRKTIDPKIVSGQIHCHGNFKKLDKSSTEGKNRPRVSIRKLMSLFNAPSTSPDRQMTDDSSHHRETTDVYQDYFNTMYTLAVDNEVDTIRCVAAVVISLINTPNYVHTKSPAYEVFLDDPSSDLSSQSPPSIHTVQAFITELYKYAQLEFESLIIALIYIDRLRLMTAGNLCICQENWQSILFVALNTGSRVWDDFAMLQRSVGNIFPQFDVRRISALATNFVLLLEFRLYISRDDYAKYFYHVHRIQRKAEYMDSDSEISIKVPRKSLVQAAGGAVLSMLRNVFTAKSSKVYCKDN